MNLKRLFKKDYIIGLDIGSSSVKVAQFAQDEGGLRLIRTDLKEFKQAEEDALNDQEALSALKSLLKGIDVKRSRIIVNINCPQSAIKKVLVPYMPMAELKEGIRLEAKNYFPFPIDDSSIDFEILGDVVEKGVRKYEVIVAVSPQKTIDRYLSLLENAGIKPASFVCSSYALQNLAGHSQYKEGETRCFIDIGAKDTELVITRGKHLMFSRNIPVAGDDFTKAMTGTLISDRGKMQLSTEEAEKIKRDVGLPSEGDSRMIDDKISAAQILSMLRATAEHLVSEIERCFDYYREESGGGKIDSVTLFGGGAASSRLIGYLSDSLGVEVRLGDPVEDLKIDKGAVGEREKTAYRLDLAIGAALSHDKSVNLLPVEIKEESKRVIRRGTIEGIVTAVILILALTYIGMKIQLANFQKRIAVSELELAGLKPQIGEAEAMLMAGMILADEPYWEDIFKELGSLVPPEIHITDIAMKNNIITMRGIVASKDEERVITNFILSLEKGIFDNVKLVSTKDLEGKAEVEFELRCWVDYEE